MMFSMNSGLIGWRIAGFLEVHSCWQEYQSRCLQEAGVAQLALPQRVREL